MKALMIPSAILIPREMQKRFGKIPTVLYPLGDMSILEHIYRKYKNAVDKIYVIAYKKHVLIEDYIKIKKLPVEIICLTELKDLGYTVLCGLEYILAHNSKLDYLHINFADTLLDDPLESIQKDIAYFSEAPLEEEWTYFQEKEGKITEILDKVFNDAQEKEEAFYKLFVGSFGIKKVEEFYHCLVEMNHNVIPQNEDTFYGALREYSARNAIQFIAAQNWFDVGHSYNYLKAKTGVEARSFNTIVIDEKRGILKKTSNNKDKLVNEINWYIKMPNRLQYLIPRIYNYSLDLEQPYVEMEYYGYNTLHELLIYANIPLIKWQMIFEKLLFVVEDMGQYTVSCEFEELKRALYNIYVEKTLKRLDSMRTHPDFKALFENKITINGYTYPNLDDCLKLLPALVDQIVIQPFNGNFQIIHGDLCFSNILLEENHGFVRVIDPRGQFGKFDLYGDQRYEIAKLLHSLEGNYDYIIENMFSIEKEGIANFTYEIPSKSDGIFTIFQDVFIKKLTDVNAIRLIEATLFLSMIPLHNDSLTRQYAMLATGLQLLGRVLKDEKRFHYGRR